MPLAGIRLIRQVFSEQLPKGFTLAQAYMELKHDGGIESQVLTFHVIDPHGKTFVVVSDKVPSRDDVNELAKATAQLFMKGKINEPPSGVDATHGGERSVDHQDQAHSGRDSGAVSRPDGSDEAGSD
jgi:hypothetical protein